MNSKAKRSRDRADQLVFTSAVMGAEFTETTQDGRKLWLLAGREVTRSVDRLLTARRLAYGKVLNHHGDMSASVRWTFKEITGQRWSRPSDDRAQALSRVHRHQNVHGTHVHYFGNPPAPGNWGPQSLDAYAQHINIDTAQLKKAQFDLYYHSTARVWGDSIRYTDATTVEADRIVREANKDEAQREDSARERDDHSGGDAWRRALTDHQHVAQQAQRLVSDTRPLVHGRSGCDPHREPNEEGWARVQRRPDRAKPTRDRASTKGEEDCPTETRPQMPQGSAPIATTTQRLSTCGTASMLLATRRK